MRCRNYGNPEIYSITTELLLHSRDCYLHFLSGSNSICFLATPNAKEADTKLELTTVFQVQITGLMSSPWRSVGPSPWAWVPGERGPNGHFPPPHVTHRTPRHVVTERRKPCLRLSRVGVSTRTRKEIITRTQVQSRVEISERHRIGSCSTRTDFSKVGLDGGASRKVPVRVMCTTSSKMNGN